MGVPDVIDRPLVGQDELESDIGTAGALDGVPSVLEDEGLQLDPCIGVGVEIW